MQDGLGNLLRKETFGGGECWGCCRLRRKQGYVAQPVDGGYSSFSGRRGRRPLRVHGATRRWRLFIVYGRPPAHIVRSTLIGVGADSISARRTNEANAHRITCAMEHRMKTKFHRKPIMPSNTSFSGRRGRRPLRVHGETDGVRGHPSFAAGASPPPYGGEAPPRER